MYISQAHVELYCVEVFFDKLSTLHDASKGNREALHRLALLFALHMIRSNTGDFSEVSDKFETTFVFCHNEI